MKQPDLNHLKDRIIAEHDCTYKNVGMRESDKHKGACYHIDDILDDIDRLNSCATTKAVEIIERMRSTMDSRLFPDKPPYVELGQIRNVCLGVFDEAIATIKEEKSEEA